MKQGKKRYLIVIFIINLILISLSITSMSNPLDDYINISVEEAWDMLSNTDNGFQIPIDVRTDVEWNYHRIDTPYPEYPRHFVLDDIQDEESYQTFINLYNGNDVIMYCKAGSRSATAAGVLIDRGFNGTVYNVKGGITEWETKGLPIKNGNDPPETPEIPTGSTVCNINEKYSFSSRSTDVNGDVIRLGFDWNDDEYIDEWSDYFPADTLIEMEHSWSTDGIYHVTVIAQDHVGSQSTFSDPLEITINHLPSLPQIQGPTDGSIDEEYEYIFMATDQDSDELYYYVEWGDDSNSDWIGPYDEGETVSMNHIWQTKGSYTIKVKVKDEHDAETEWATYQVSMPKLKSDINLIDYIVHVLNYFKNIFNNLFITYY